MSPAVSFFGPNGARRIDVIGTEALPEDSRITHPIVVVHILDASSGKYLTKGSGSKVIIQLLFKVVDELSTSS